MRTQGAGGACRGQGPTQVRGEAGQELTGPRCSHLSPWPAGGQVAARFPHFQLARRGPEGEREAPEVPVPVYQVHTSKDSPRSPVGQNHDPWLPQAEKEAARTSQSAGPTASRQQRVGEPAARCPYPSAHGTGRLALRLKLVPLQGWDFDSYVGWKQTQGEDWRVSVYGAL